MAHAAFTRAHCGMLASGFEENFTLSRTWRQQQIVNLSRWLHLKDLQIGIQRKRMSYLPFLVHHSARELMGSLGNIVSLWEAERLLHN
jgi:hypothetical protein